MPPPIPFPYPLHIGTDICRVARIARLLRSSKQAARFIRRVLAPEELARARPAVRQVLARAAAAQAVAQQAMREGSSSRLETGGGGVRVSTWRGGQLAGGSGEWGRRDADAVELVVEGGGRGDGPVGLSGRGGGEVGEGEAGGDDEAVFWRAATFMAGRFAAKEAAFKAHPHLRLGFHDIIILPSSDAGELTGEAPLTGLASSAPVALIKGDAEGGRDQMAKVSISHDGEYATAMCIGFEASGGGLD